MKVGSAVEVCDCFALEDPSRMLSQIKSCDAPFGQTLYELLQDGRLKKQYGAKTQLLLLCDQDQLISFCTYAESEDIATKTSGPWIGFAYTFPVFRGKRRAGKLFEYAYLSAKQEGYAALYTLAHGTRLFEKYGFRHVQSTSNNQGEVCQIYELPVVHHTYDAILGTHVRGTVDRPRGSHHPRHPEMVYPVNYGYVDGVLGGDGAWQDVYILGEERPIDRFEGEVIGVYHRLNDCEDKWIVRMDHKTYTRDEILQSIAFQEQFFMGELYVSGAGEHKAME